MPAHRAPQCRRRRAGSAAALAGLGLASAGWLGVPAAASAPASAPASHCGSTPPTCPTPPASPSPSPSPVASPSPSPSVSPGPGPATPAPAPAVSGGLVITKVLTGAPEGFAPAFVIAYSCSGGPSGTVSLLPGTSATVGGIPDGSVCTVTEQVLPEPAPGLVWGTAVITGSPTSPITAAQPGDVTVTNVLVPVPAGESPSPAPLPEPGVLPPLPEPATVPGPGVVPGPATVPVPTEGRLPATVPAGEGGPRGSGLVVAALLAAGLLVGATAALARRRRS